MNTHTVTITSPAIWKRAQAKATKAGISVDEYVNRILQHHVAPGDNDPWGPVPKAVSQRWDKAEAAFEEEDRKNPQPRFTSGREFVEHMRCQP